MVRTAAHAILDTLEHNVSHIHALEYYVIHPLCAPQEVPVCLQITVLV
jgi:hypothetical protein